MGDSKRRARVKEQATEAIASGEAQTPINSLFSSLDPSLVEHLNLEQTEFCQQYATTVEQLRNTYSQFIPHNQVERLVREFENNPQTKELIAFAAVQSRKLSQLPLTEDDDAFTEEEDYRCTFWEVGRWDGAWDDPDCEQEWKGDPSCGYC